MEVNKAFGIQVIKGLNRGHHNAVLLIFHLSFSVHFIRLDLDFID